MYQPIAPAPFVHDPLPLPNLALNPSFSISEKIIGGNTVSNGYIADGWAFISNVGHYAVRDGQVLGIVIYKANNSTGAKIRQYWPKSEINKYGSKFCFSFNAVFANGNQGSVTIRFLKPPSVDAFTHDPLNPPTVLAEKTVTVVGKSGYQDYKAELMDDTTRHFLDFDGYSIPGSGSNGFIIEIDLGAYNQNSAGDYLYIARPKFESYPSESVTGITPKLPTPFVIPDYHAELKKCRRWYGTISQNTARVSRYGLAISGVSLEGGTFFFPETTWRAPLASEITATGLTYFNCTHYDYFTSESGFVDRVTLIADGIYSVYKGSYTYDLYPAPA